MWQGASLATQTPARDGPSILVERHKGRLSGDDLRDAGLWDQISSDLFYPTSLQSILAQSQHPDLGSATDVQGSSGKGGTRTTCAD